ncbi:hypothetical protein BASA61_004419 [Batrachochytrium salamandrivorans]|nr:hypothetical protein BASA61_004419 [Batrachochytrium salamandrivorans]
MEPATVTLRELKIKAGVVKRTSKEYHAYMKESTTQQARIDALIARSADDADIRKQREVLEETTQMLPDTKASIDGCPWRACLRSRDPQGKKD